MNRAIVDASSIRKRTPDARARQVLTLAAVETETAPDELLRRFTLATQILMRGAERRAAAEAAAAAE